MYNFNILNADSKPNKTYFPPIDARQLWPVTLAFHSPRQLMSRRVLVSYVKINDILIYFNASSIFFFYNYRKNLELDNITTCA